MAGFSSKKPGSWMKVEVPGTCAFTEVISTGVFCNAVS